MASTLVEILGKDSTGSAFDSVNKNLSRLAVSALKTTASIAGIGLSIAGVVDAIKGIGNATIQIQQFTSTLQVGTGSAKGAAEALSFVRAESHRLGLDLATAADQFAKLTAASKGTSLEGQATTKLFSAMSEAATVLGLSADQTRGALSAFQQMISKGKVQAEELRGQLGERLPGAFQLAAKAMGVTTAELDKLLVAGKVTAEDLLPKLTTELNKTFGAQAEQSAKGLASQINRMNTAIFELKIAVGESGLINFLSSGIELATRLGNALARAFGGGQQLNAIEKQVSLIKTLEGELESLQNLTHVPLIGDLIFDKKQADLLKFRIDAAKEDLQKLKDIASIPIPKDRPVLQSKAAEDPALAKKALDELNKAQDFAIAREHEYIKLLEIERKAHSDLVKPYLDSAKSAEQRLSVMDDEITSMKYARSAGISLEKAIELTTIARLEEKKVIEKDSGVVSQIQREIDARKRLSDLIPKHEKLADQTKLIEQARNTTDQVSQLWTQAGRNIQSTLANSIFNFFDDGFKGMVKNVGVAIGHIMSEFAALKLAQGIGLAGMFGMTGNAAASTGGASSLLSGGMNLASLALGGFGTTGLIGSGLARFGGSVGAFGAGMAGTGAGVFSAAGGAGTAFIGGAGTALGGSGMGAAATMGAMASAALALVAVDVVGRLLAGNKTLKGWDKIPVLGGFAAALFGHGPMKFRQQSLQGTATDSGFEGNITNVFRAKGGLLVGNKHKSVSEDLTLEMQTLLDGTLKGFADSTRGFAKNLGVSADFVDHFSKEFQIKSEKGKKLTDEAIQEMLRGIGNEFARGVLPIVDTLRKAGEDSFSTLQRLSAEFQTLANASLILGKSVAEANEFIKGVSFGDRTAFIDAAGGMEALNQKAAFFADNFLTEADRIAPASERLTEAMAGLGLNAAMSKDQFRDLVQSFGQVNGISAETLQAMLNLAPAFMQVKNAGSALAQSAFGDLSKSVESERNRLTTDYNDALKIQNNRIQTVTDSIGRLSELSKALKSTLSTIRPISLGEAQGKIQSAIDTMRGGRSVIASDIQDALSRLADQDTSKFSTLVEFQRSQAKSADLVSTLSSMTDAQLTLEERTLSALVAERDRLKIGFDNEISRLDSILTNAQEQLGTLSAIKDLLTAQADFNSAISANKNVNPISGNPSITGAQILDFSRANAANPMAIYQAAIDNHVSSAQIAASGAFTQQQIDQFVRDNNLASFDVGTSFVPRTGLAMVHKGEQIINSSKNADIALALQELVAEIKKVVASSGKTAELLDSVSGGGGAFLTEAA